MNTNFFVEIGAGLGSAFFWAVSSWALTLQSTVGYLLSSSSYPDGPTPPPGGHVPTPTLSKIGKLAELWKNGPRNRWVISAILKFGA